jgi:hypothetical protein
MDVFSVQERIVIIGDSSRKQTQSNTMRSDRQTAMF